MISSENNIRLRPLSENDISVLAKLAHNKKIWDNLRDYMPYPYTEKDAIFFIDLIAKENPPMTFGIDYKNELCGVIGLIPQKDVYCKTAEIGYWLGEEYWGKGIATVALKLLTDYGLNTVGFVRLHTGVYEYNIASMKVLEKCGYTKDGIFKKAVFKNGVILDEHKYSITK
jgi:[ribosomal protein S5]-alanine N-acetyltransferase